MGVQTCVPVILPPAIFTAVLGASLLSYLGLHSYLFTRFMAQSRTSTVLTEQKEWP